MFDWRVIVPATIGLGVLICIILYLLVENSHLSSENEHLKNTLDKYYLEEGQ